MSNTDTGTGTLCAQIRFRTRNSVYRFMHVPGASVGTMLCESGTFEGKAFTLPVVQVRDNTWTGLRLCVEDPSAREALDNVGRHDLPARAIFTTSEIVWTDRPDDLVAQRADARVFTEPRAFIGAIVDHIVPGAVLR